MSFLYWTVLVTVTCRSSQVYLFVLHDNGFSMMFSTAQIRNILYCDGKWKPGLLQTVPQMKLWAGWPGFYYRQCRTVLSRSQRPDLLWGLPSLLSSECHDSSVGEEEEGGVEEGKKGNDENQKKIMFTRLICFDWVWKYLNRLRKTQSGKLASFLYFWRDLSWQNNSTTLI
jgi:hypothetical protein